MAEGDGFNADARTWRLTGARRWLPVLLLALFVTQAVGRLVELVVEPPPHLVDWLLLVVGTLGTAVATAMVVLSRRTRVTLGPGGIEVRERRTRLVPWADVLRAHRDRFRGAVSLDLVDGRSLLLPAPVTGPRDVTAEVDEAVALITTRLEATRPEAGEGVGR